MSITITPHSTPAEQLQQCESYILAQAQRCTFDSTDICFLPPSAINHLATLANIEALCAQDAGLAALQWPSHSRAFFAEKVFQHGQKCFALTVYAELGMPFLIKLLNMTNDKYLPITDLSVIAPEYRGHLEIFANSQAAVCAPVFTVGVFEQKAQFRRSLPFVEVKLRRVSRSGNVYDVTFHREHLRLSVALLSRYTGSTRWKMKVFRDMEVAKLHLFWEEGKFGFWCEDEYYLCF